MGIIKKVLILVIFFSLTLLPTIVLAEEPSPITSEASQSSSTVDSYDLFWPVFAGKTMDESMYPLKLVKESIGEFFAFGDLNKTKYNTTLSEKRLLEAEKLIKNKSYKNLKATLDSSQEKRQKALSFFQKAKDNNRHLDQLKETMANSLNNQLKLLFALKLQVSSDNQSLLDSSINQVKDFLSKFQ